MNKNIIKLKNVSKFYYNKGIIATGFTRINLEFKIGEFVAITGESGSGKSTLLNVISGLDTYEEGEMYINGKETSHYNEKDFENYRRQYIGNIFQNFNLVNSYTVYQNIELVLLLNGNSKKEIKDKVLQLIKDVDLHKFRNTLASKLSGGQKQRVAIARALAKDTPIILADEPTGNLDSTSAKEIIKLLSIISKDKLVIIVTHNYEQVEKYVTRKIKMHDGKILEDKTILPTKENLKPKIPNCSNINLTSKLRLGIRNTFNIIPKFLLILAVYLFITVALTSEYSAFKKQEFIAETSGYNYLFQNLEDNRIIIKKQDNTPFNTNDYKSISTINNIDTIVENDLLLDNTVNLVNDNFWIYATVNNINNLEGNIDKGRMPTNDEEVIIVGNIDDYYIGYMADELLNKELSLQDIYTGEINNDIKLKVVGIQYSDTIDYYSNNQIYVNNTIIEKLTYQINQQYSHINILFQDKYYNSNYYNNFFKISPHSKINKGEAYISNDLNYLCPNNNCLNQKINIELENIYYKDNLNLTVSKTYNKQNLKTLLNIEDYESNNGVIFINPDDYNSLFNKSTYQSSIFVKDVKLIDETVNLLNEKGYNTLKIKDTLIQDGTTQLIKIMGTVVTIALVIVLFFISYFVIRVILKSRNIYFATIRMLGATKKISKQLLIIELLTVSNIAYFSFIIIIYLNYLNIFNIEFINTIINYLTLKDYLILYSILIIMSYLISTKFSKKLFKESTMKTIKEEV